MSKPEAMTLAGAAPAMDRPQLSGRDLRRALGSVMIGNWFELFDFIIYGYFAAQIGKAMFPAADPLTSVLASFATYGVGFVMRPVGAIVIGSYGDRYGRKAALVLTMLIMAAATAMTGLIPSYAAIGVAAPLALVACRLLQGFATGGEWGGATAFLVEFAPPGRRGFFGSLQQLSTSLAIVSAIGLALLLNLILSEADLQAWGWRIPFLLGFLVAPLGFWLRAHVAETPAYMSEARAHEVPRAPLREAFVHHSGAIARVLGVTTIWTIGSYIFTTFLATHATQTLGAPAPVVLTGTLAGAIVNIATIPLFGWLSDKVGRKPLLILSALGCLVLAWPLFALVSAYPGLWTVLAVTATGGVLTGIFSGAAPAFLCELLPTRVRYTAMSAGYNAAVMLFGGFAPFISTLLVRETGYAAAPGFYVMAGAALTLVTLLTLRYEPDRYFQDA